jgi:predicted nucleic acid-binding protein
MTAVLVDSNVLIDVMTDDPFWSSWSTEALRSAAETDRLVINPVIYGEVSIRFSQIEEVERALPRTMFQREHIPYEAAFLAGKVFVQYKRGGGAKSSPLPDFYIGAHAAVLKYTLLTRDSTRYRTYFKQLRLISPHH